MYLHHQRKVNEKNNLGWLRSSYHLHIQQIASQDPPYYALVTATSRNWWQISYPYYMKVVLPGDYTAFQHLDLNLRTYIECDRGANRIQTSLTLTSEVPENCTFVVAGFNKRIKEWWSVVIKRPGPGRKAQKHNSNCLRTNRIYTKKDKLKYGSYVPTVCGPGDIRISTIPYRVTIHYSLAPHTGMLSCISFCI